MAQIALHVNLYYSTGVQNLVNIKSYWRAFVSVYVKTTLKIPALKWICAKVKIVTARSLRKQLFTGRPRFLLYCCPASLYARTNIRRGNKTCAEMCRLRISKRHINPPDTSITDSVGAPKWNLPIIPRGKDLKSRQFNHILLSNTRQTWQQTPLLRLLFYCAAPYYAAPPLLGSF